MEELKYPMVTCRECGKEDEARYMNPTKSEMVEESLCFTCLFWFEIIERGQVRHIRKNLGSKDMTARIEGLVTVSEAVYLQHYKDEKRGKLLDSWQRPLPNGKMVTEYMLKTIYHVAFNTTEQFKNRHSGWKGYGGRLWTITYLPKTTLEGETEAGMVKEEVVEVFRGDNLWSQGEVPVRFWDRLPANATLEWEPWPYKAPAQPS